LYLDVDERQSYLGHEVTLHLGCKTLVCIRGVQESGGGGMGVPCQSWTFPQPRRICGLWRDGRIWGG